MITRLTGLLEAVEGAAASVRLPGGLALEVLLPAYLARTLATQVGQPVTFHTLAYLEGQGQGTSFLPRLIGFASPAERRFFEVFTSVKGIGNRKALRAMAEPVGVIAAAVQRQDARALIELPEIGRRMADTIIAELKGKLDAFVTDTITEARAGARPAPAPRSDLPPAQRDAVDALISLGETRADAEAKVRRALERAADLDTPERIVAAVFGSVS
ncbi:MAG: hypothetical protein KIT68_07200 [Phycisphaeraceae bacterium]|nr:hypothetical protein [Phycisphaeraceae bacterium]